MAPSHVAQRYTSRLLHRFRTCAQKSSSNLLHRCCLVFMWTTARGGRNTPFGCAVHPARVVSMMRLQACQCHPHELLLLVSSISVSSRTTFPFPRNVLLRPCLRCTNSSAHTPFVNLVDNLVRLPPQHILDKGAFGVGVAPKHWAISPVKYTLWLFVSRFLSVLPLLSKPAQDECPYAMPFGHFVHFFTT